ncbi:formyltetrahydrofolate-dependent phosphoribosylglycinamide formyltransferase [Sporobacter termitidis DSM 10068]|uniref:Phosphoribosylglycinamide formyltransferase n=1 Tax=Sporobacter termitidis DSM 10068 TaxID=1123282 RepID=A0A1M5X575_9FIRM|nr:phosphoribosylglycinamide formyltransferase [Sporobacter termitidis]SHH94966.1 formyltetrahydrofolate-dependent phosphoribosylglycinamide formyltransferase [Sporobacter termitidis DSM 10068]
MVKTAILVSGDGTNLQAIINAHNFGKIKNCELTAVISSRPNAFALERAKNAGIQTFVVDYSMFPSRAGFNEAIYQKLKSLDIELVVMAGFMVVLGSPVVEAFEHRIINIHPSLVPAFCGNGFYGIRVHEEALNYGVKVSGATAHFATAVADAGPVILQRVIDVREDDTPASLQKRIMEEVEWKILPEAVSLYCEGRLKVVGRIVHIKDA